MLQPILAVLRGNKNFIYIESREFKMGTVHLWEIAIKNSYNTYPGLPIDSRDKTTMLSIYLHTDPWSLKVQSSPEKSHFRYKLERSWVYFNKALTHLLMAATLGFTHRIKSQAKRVHFRHLPPRIWPEEARCPLSNTICCYRAGSWNYWVDYWVFAMPVPPTPLPSSCF